MTGAQVVQLVVFVLLFLAVAVMGFMASRWRRADDMASLHEWGLGGKSFGTWTTWFLLGGDLYTAYTFIAVPAAMWATGAVSGFFAVPYTIVLYPVIFYFLGRMWSVAHRHGYVTTADIVQGRYGTRSLSLAVAVTGILTTAGLFLLALQRLLTGPELLPSPGRLVDLSARETAVVGALLVVSVVMGLLPGPLLALVGPAAEALVDALGR